MNTQIKIAAAIAALLSSGVAGAAGLPMQINVGVVNGGVSLGNITPAGVAFGAGGAPADPLNDTITGTFTEFGFNQFQATSIYTPIGGGLATIRDTNVTSVLAGFGIAATPYGNTTIGNLSPLTPPHNVAFVDTEGFSGSWGLVGEYDINGTIGFDGTNFNSLPSFTTGSYNVWFDDYSNGFGRDLQVLGLTLTGSSIVPADANLFFDVTFALPGFLLINQGAGFIDASTLVGLNPAQLTMTLDTNINPAIPPSFAGLLATNTDASRYRRTNLDGTISPSIPEPSMVALLGVGLLGFAASRRKAA